MVIRKIPRVVVRCNFHDPLPLGSLFDNRAAVAIERTSCHSQPAYFDLLPACVLRFISTMRDESRSSDQIACGRSSGSRSNAVGWTRANFRPQCEDEYSTAFTGVRKVQKEWPKNDEATKIAIEFGP
jgi:hypothetical protein